MRRIALCLGLLALWTLPAQANEAENPTARDDTPTKTRKKKKNKKAKKARANKHGRVLDPESPEAFALEKLLAIPARYAKDGSVRLVYSFMDPIHAGDWQQQGFAVEGRAGPRWRRHKWQGKRPKYLSLAVASRKRGMFRHKLGLKGELDVTFEVQVDRMTSRSDLVFLVGKAGVRFGNQFVKAGSSGFRPVPGSVRRPGRSAFDRSQHVSVRLVYRDKQLTAWVNGTRAGSTTRLEGKLDGQVGIYATDMNLHLHRVTILGKVDKAKL